MHMRPYAHEDMPLLQETLARWIGEAGDCGYGHVGDLPHRIYAGLRGRRPVGELVHIWEDQAGVAGLAVTFRFEQGFDVHARPALRGTAAELEMLRAAADATGRLVQQAGGAEVITDVFDCDRTRMAQLRRLGFAEYRMWDHVTERPLDDPPPAPELPHGFVIRHASPDDYAQLAAARNDAFDEGWTPELYRDEVMRRPGYAPERELVVAAPDGQIAAFTVTWLDALNRVGLLEPVGTMRAYQRRGLARALLLHALRLMHAQGMRRAAVAHDATNLPAAALYRSLGFEQKYATLGYRRAG